MQVLKQEINDRIRKKALNIFLANGFEKTSMREIAGKTGISVSNLYNYFENKMALFHAIADPAYFRLNALLDTFFKAEEKKVFNNDAFVEEFVQLTAEKIGSLIKTGRDSLLLLMDASNGTKYENFKHTIISVIEKHFKNHLKRKQLLKKSSLDKNGFIMHIIATNLVESVLEIARHYEEDCFVDVNITMLMKYHVKGIQQFF